MKTNGKHETSRSWLRSAKKDNAVARAFAGLDNQPKKTEAIQGSYPIPGQPEPDSKAPQTGGADHG